jgi:ABC-type branched-subunit amino acid transport system permease subunit
VALVYPLLVTLPYYQSIGILAMLYVGMAVAFDLVVGRVGALSLAQPVFLGIGAYTAGILSSKHDTNFVWEVLLGGAIAALAALVIGIPAFRLSMHSFAMATLAFGISGTLIARNWISVTGGPLCTTGIAPLNVAMFGFNFTPDTYVGQYYVALFLALLIIAVVLMLTRRRIGLALTAVRDDDILAGSRGVWPMEYRLLAFAVSAAMTAMVGAYLAHMQTVVCPNIVDMSYTIELLIMVFIGGRGSLRGVITAAVLFTALPQVLRLADQWRLVLYGLILVVIVTTVPDGIEQLYRKLDKLLRRHPPEGQAAPDSAEPGPVKTGAVQ